MFIKDLIPYLKIAHGCFNTIIMFLFFYQGWLGMGIRKARLSNSALPTARIKRHRKIGPFLVLFGFMGFCAGLTIGYIDHKHIFHYPLHFITGSFISVSIFSTFLVSRRIGALDSPLRQAHFTLGVTLLCLYPIQIFLGLGILL